MWLGITYALAGVTIALAFFVVWLLRAWQAERKELYDRIQAGTLRDYAVIEQARAEVKPTPAGALQEAEVEPEFEPPFVDMGAADSNYHSLMG
jgi:hypothetical protein